MNYTWYMAKRLYSHEGDERRVSRPAIRIATAGVAIGLMVMIISVCVVMGFKSEIQKKVVGMGCDITVTNYESLNRSVPIPIHMDDSIMRFICRSTGVKHVQRYCEITGMLKTNDSFRGIMLRGVGPEYKMDFLQNCIIDGQLESFSDSTSSNKIVISKKIADELKLKVGDRIYTYFFNESVKVRRFTVGAIYQTYMNEFDESLIFTDMYTTQRISKWAPDECGGAQVQLRNIEDVNDVALDMALRFHDIPDGTHYAVITIYQLFPSIFSWLSLLDTNVVVILILMIVVAGFTMVSGLLIIILERTNFIGVMKALGAHNSELRHMFIYFAIFIIFRGLVIGNIVGIGLAYLQMHTGIIQLDPDTYYVQSVPMLINWPVIGIINLATMVLSVLVLIIPSYLVSSIHPARSIRFE